jgi:hypothetical protein
MRPPLEGSAIQASMNVDKEWQIRGKVCAFKARDDERYVVYKQTILQSSVKCQVLIVILKRVLHITRLSLVKTLLLRIGKVILDLVTKTVLYVIQTFLK